MTDDGGAVRTFQTFGPQVSGCRGPVRTLGCAMALVASVAAGCASAPVAPEPPVIVADVNWGAWTARARELLERVVVVNTAPPRHARKEAPTQLQAFLQRESVECELLDVGGDHWAVWGRVEAVDALGPPVVLLSHLDTGAIEQVAWPRETPALAVTEREETLWGAGISGGKGIAVLHATTLGVLASVGGPQGRDVHMVALPDALELNARSLDRVIAAVPSLATATVALSSGGYDVADWFGDGRTVQAIAVGEASTVDVQVAAVTRSDGRGPTSSERLAQALVAIAEAPVRPRLTPTNRALVAASAEGLGAVQSWIRGSSFTAQLFVVPDFASRPGLSQQFADQLRTTRVQSGQRGGTGAPHRSRAFLRAQLLDDTTPAILVQRLRRAVDDPDVHITIRAASALTMSGVRPQWLDRIRRASQVGEETVTVPILGRRPLGSAPLREVGVPVFGYAPIRLSPNAIGRDGPQSLPTAVFRQAVERMATLVANLSAR